MLDIHTSQGSNKVWHPADTILSRVSEKIMRAKKLYQLLTLSFKFWSEVPAVYFVHMKGQFKYIHQQKQPGRLIDGSVQLTSVREIFLLENHGKNRCLLPHEYSDSYWYESSEKEMVNCTVPWTMNNSRICSNWEEAEEATKIDRRKNVSSWPILYIYPNHVKKCN